MIIKKVKVKPNVSTEDILEWIVGELDRIDKKVVDNKAIYNALLKVKEESDCLDLVGQNMNDIVNCMTKMNEKTNINYDDLKERACKTDIDIELIRTNNDKIKDDVCCIDNHTKSLEKLVEMYRKKHNVLICCTLAISIVSLVLSIVAFLVK